MNLGINTGKGMSRDYYRLLAVSSLLRPADQPIASEIAFLSRSLQLVPTCIITYRRLAFVGSAYEPGLRITFDQMLHCRAPSLGLAAGTELHAFLPTDAVSTRVTQGCQTNRPAAARITTTMATAMAILGFADGISIETSSPAPSRRIA